MDAYRHHAPVLDDDDDSVVADDSGVGWDVVLATDATVGSAIGGHVKQTNPVFLVLLLLSIPPGRQLNDLLIAVAAETRLLQGSWSNVVGCAGQGTVEILRESIERQTHSQKRGLRMRRTLSFTIIIVLTFYFLLQLLLFAHSLHCHTTTTTMPTGVSAPAPAAVRRTKNTTAYLPIVYGSLAFFLGKKKADEHNTHEWTLFLRAANQEDLSPVISKVVFQLHPSFAQPTRELTEPPYEVTERGWGEFEAQIRIHWKETAQERTTVLNHTIKLYPPGTPPNMAPTSKNTQDVDKPVLEEFYDEVVFTDPAESFYRSLQQIEHLPKMELPLAAAPEGEAGSGSKLQKEHVEHYDDQKDFLALVAAQNFLQDELSKVKRRFQVVMEESAAVDQQLAVAAATGAAAPQSLQRTRESHAAATATGEKAAASAAAAAAFAGKKRPQQGPKGKKPPPKKVKTTNADAGDAGTTTLTPNAAGSGAAAAAALATGAATM